MSELNCMILLIITDVCGECGGFIEGGSVVPNCEYKVMEGKTVKVWIQKIKNNNLITYFESLLSYIIEQEFTNTFQNTGCNRRNGPDFGRVFLRSNYTDITQNTYIQS